MPRPSAKTIDISHMFVDFSLRNYRLKFCYQGFGKLVDKISDIVGFACYRPVGKSLDNWSVVDNLDARGMKFMYLSYRPKAESLDMGNVVDNLPIHYKSMFVSIPINPNLPD